MNFRIKVLLLFLTYAAVSCKNNRAEIAEPVAGLSPTALLEVEVLMTKMDEKDIKIVDFRKPELYREQHIPNAINLWRTDLENETFSYGGMMPSKEQLEHKLGSLGIDQNDLLVVYDDKGSVDAARFWWILKYYQFDTVKILNGGLSAWKNAGGSISRDEISVLPTQLSLPDSTRGLILANKGMLKSWMQLRQDGIKLIDVRSGDEFSGKVQKAGARRAGRIPGSIHIEWSEAIDPQKNNRFRAAQDLQKIFDDHGIGKNDTVVVYCHSGSRSSHTTFVLQEILNYNWVMNYDGSWVEWSYFDELPIETDSLNLTIK